MTKESAAYKMISDYVDGLGEEDRRTFCKAVLKKLNDIKRQERRVSKSTPGIG
jgi:hypothetical protein